jgi:hypothetical protein
MIERLKMIDENIKKVLKKFKLDEKVYIYPKHDRVYMGGKLLICYQDIKLIRNELIQDYIMGGIIDLNTDVDNFEIKKDKLDKSDIKYLKETIKEVENRYEKDFMQKWREETIQNIKGRIDRGYKVMYKLDDKFEHLIYSTINYKRVGVGYLDQKNLKEVDRDKISVGKDIEKLLKLLGDSVTTIYDVTYKNMTDSVYHIRCDGYGFIALDLTSQTKE